MRRSNLKEFPNYRVSKRGRVVRLSDGKVIKCYLNRKFNRYYCWIYNLKGIRVKIYRYRLVAMAWIPNPENKPEVCHKDNNSVHDYYKNLYWGTHQENMEQMARDGRSTKNRSYIKSGVERKRGSYTICTKSYVRVELPDIPNNFSKSELKSIIRELVNMK